MRLRTLFLLILAFLGIWGVMLAQKPFKQYPGGQDGDVPLPPDWDKPTEWSSARLRYRDLGGGRFGGFGGFGGRRGFGREGSWGTDYPLGGRHLAEGLRRLTKVNARSVEQVVELDDTDDIFNWPWLVAGEMGDWKLTAAQAKTIREYLLRGGFIYMDDFWGPEEWARFDESMKVVFPDRPTVDIDNKDSIFHVVYDLDDRYQILGMWALRGRGGFMGQRAAGTVARWEGVYDDKNRLMVTMSFNSDVGDSWEFADDPTYPEKFSALGIRIGVNYVVYAMTH